MPIEYRTGDLFESGADALVNPVNCVGVMGRGLAKEFKRRYPEYFQSYNLSCKEGVIRLGEIAAYGFFRYPGEEHLGPAYIFSFPTKQSWRDKSRLEDIDPGLVSLARALLDRPHVHSVALPKLGCGLGGLDWADVKPEIEAALGGTRAKVLVYE